MELVAFDPEHHLGLLRGWWAERGVAVPDPELMAPTGYIVVFNRLPVCAGFLFKTDAKIAVISHLVSSAEPMDPEIRGQSLNLLLAKLVSRAREDGFKMVSASSNLERLNARYEAMGFQKTDEGEVHYGRVL